MRIEQLPLVLGVLLGLIGLALIFDATAQDDALVSKDRRHRPRRERNRKGEALVGLGVVAMAAAFLGRDEWRYSTVAVIVGTLLLLWGAKLNGSYLRGIVGGGRMKRPKPKLADGPRRVR